MQLLVVYWVVLLNLNTASSPLTSNYKFSLEIGILCLSTEQRTAMKIFHTFLLTYTLLKSEVNVKRGEGDFDSVPFSLTTKN